MSPGGRRLSARPLWANPLHVSPAGVVTGREYPYGVDISPRQSFILSKVVEAHVELDHPVGSKWIAELDDVPWGPSTVRGELARLEEAGLLEHPHTSAGRVPTDRGYRIYVDDILVEGRLPVPNKRLELSTMRREVDEAMRATSEQLSQVTNLLALVTAPPIETATIRRVEVLLLQPQVAMVVVITSTGGVTKRVVSYDEPADPGLVDWAVSYLNEAVGGLDVGSRILAARLTDPELGPVERDFLATLAPAFTELESTAENTLYMDGAARLLSEHRFQELSQLGALMEVLEHRRALLGVLRQSLTEPSVYLRIGSENLAPEMQSLSLVAANYGLARRNLGAVSVIGPMRMDYPQAIIAVRQAAGELSRFVAEVYDE
jgi:heat-inducible transcriptional repressor